MLIWEQYPILGHIRRIAEQEWAGTEVPEVTRQQLGEWILALLDDLDCFTGGCPACAGPQQHAAAQLETTTQAILALDQRRN